LRRREIHGEPESLNAKSMKKIRKRRNEKRPDSASHNISTAILTICLLAQIRVSSVSTSKKRSGGTEHAIIFLRDAQLVLHMPVDGLHSIDF